MKYLSNTTIVAIWLVAAIVGFFLGGLGLAGGIALAGVLSIVVWKYTLNSSWEGKIEDIRTDRITGCGADEESDNDHKEVTFAYIRLSNGKLKKVRPYPDWKKGDNIRKEKGKMGPEKI